MSDEGRVDVVVHSQGSTRCTHGKCGGEPLEEGLVRKDLVGVPSQGKEHLGGFYAGYVVHALGGEGKIEHGDNEG
jgi:hypothetical protein